MSEQTQFLNSITPLIDSGLPASAITVSQTLGNGLLTLTGPAGIQVQVNGPQTSITESDIAGMYPAPNSTDSPDSFLPHLALNRRTLPWERSGVAGQKPWLALLLLKDSELHPVVQFANARRLVSKGPSVVSGTVATIQGRDPLGFAKIAAKVSGSTTVNLLFLSNQLWVGIRPAQDELKLLCNVRRSNSGSGDVDTPVVIGNRLPDASALEPELHTAFLVSVENRDDIYDPSRALPANGLKEVAFIVLHSWNFTPSKGGDFEEVMRAIHIRPNGGVLRFGNLPKAPDQNEPVRLSGNFDSLLDEHGLFVDSIPHTQAGLVSFRGPLRPFPPPPRSSGLAIRSAPEEFAASPGTPKDYSHAAAFELGKLLALASHDLLEDLHNIRNRIKLIEPEVAINKLPIALQKPDWVVDPAWFEEPWSMPLANSLNPIVKDRDQFIGATPGDISGIGQQWQQFGVQVQNGLQNMQNPVLVQVEQIDIATLNVDVLDKTLGNVANKGHL